MGGTGTTLVPATAPGALTEAAGRELAQAFDALETVSLAARLASTAGTPIEMLAANLPAPIRGALDGAVRTALDTAAKGALRSLDMPRTLNSERVHRGLAMMTGFMGGALGLPGTLAELPVTTGILLRQIAAIAAEEGEDLAAPGAAAECLKVFALGGPSKKDDAADAGYFAVRIALSQALSGAIGRTLLPGFMAQIATRFGVPVGLKLSAQAAPLIGAATGAAINLAFLKHFRDVARAHFTVRRLERLYGEATVRKAWDGMKASRDERFNG